MGKTSGHCGAEARTHCEATASPWQTVPAPAQALMQPRFMHGGCRLLKATRDTDVGGIVDACAPRARLDAKTVDALQWPPYHFGFQCGAIAQLGERYNGIVEVDGSIPSGSTNSVVPIV